MENYTWNVKEIREKLKYVSQRLKKETDLRQKEILMHSLLTYINLLHTTDIKNLKFTSLMDKLTQGRFSLIRDKKYKEISDIVFDFKDYVYDDNLLINLLQNIKNSTFQTKEEILATLKLSPQELVEISKGFYKWLGDKEIYDYASEMLDNKSHLQFKDLKYQKNDFGIASGMTYYDPLFKEAYIGITQEFTLFDAQVLNHEIMHSIDFRMHQKLPSNNYYGFHEVSTYTIDYLFFDYLEEKGYDLTEINKLRDRKTEYVSRLASYSLLQLQLSNGNNFSFQNVSIENLKQSINNDIRKNLLEVQSCLIARSLYAQIKNNKEFGIANLKRFMKTNIPINQVPDFSYIGVSRQELLNTSKEIGNELSFVQRKNNGEKNIGWNDEKEKKLLFDKVQTIMDKIGDITLEIQKNTNGQVKLGNIGITFNNKIIEILQTYSENNVTFYNSKLKNVIIFYLEDIMLEALKELQSYLDLFNVKVKKFGTKKQAQSIIEQSKPILSKYTDLRQKLFDFNIDKDIIRAVLKHIEFNKENALNGGFDYYTNNPESIIQDYNKELQTLGINTEIPPSILDYENSLSNITNAEVIDKHNVFNKRSKR